MEKDIAYFAGGCFWCTEAVFQRIKGVERVTSGFSGGHIKNPAYREVITQRTGHAEAVKVEYNRTEVSYLQLLQVFFATHDPTTLNQQGADKGTHYRSAIFYTNDFQRQTAADYIKELTVLKAFKNRIVTEVTKFKNFYPAEAYHNDYYNLNNEQGYCRFVIQPKISKLNTYFRKELKANYLE